MTVSSTSNHDSSYPPLFRPYHGLDQVEPTPIIHDSDDSVPVIDLQCLNQEGKCKLNEACKNWGIFRVVNHGIPMTLLNQLHDSAKEIFSLPFESKESQSFLCSSMPYFWGTLALTPDGVPIDRGPNALNMNWVEGFHAPLSVLSQFQAQHPMADTFRYLLLEYGKHQCRVATTIFKAMAEKLKLDPEQSKPYLSTSDGYIRIYRYPHCSQADQAWGIGVHTDSSVLSILNQDEVGGLQVLNQHDKWVDVKPHPNSLIVNLGDMMKAMSDDKYKSVMHRVKISKYKDRMSFGYFVFPVDDGVIWSTKYKPFTYADFRAQVQQDLKTVGYKVGLDRLRITDTPTS